MRRRSGQREAGAPRPWLRGVSAVVVAFVTAVIVVIVAIATGPASSSGGAPASTLARNANPYLDPGTALKGPAPDFTLTDQFGRRESLRSLRGHVVVLAFNDALCTTICPLTTTAMVEAKGLLGAAGDGV
jgi:cytochrome oxidase Cu insertion factor (SCO1/SenC/PrrC family)